MIGSRSIDQADAAADPQLRGGDGGRGQRDEQVVGVRVLARQLAAAGVRRLAAGRDVRVLGEVERACPCSSTRRASLAGVDGVVGGEVADAGVHAVEARAHRPVLTDYHVHLRPDEPDTPGGALLHAPATPSATATAAEEHGIAELGVAEHVYRFAAALEVWDHPFWREWARDDLDAYCGFVREETDLRLGIEADFVAGPRGPDGERCSRRATGTSSSARCTSCATARWTRRTTRSGAAGESAEKVWRRYFETVAESALSGLYDVIAHPDLVKVWGDRAPRPDKRPALLLRAGRRGVRGGRRRRRGLHRGPAQAGRRDLPGAAVPGDGARRGLPDRALQRRARARPARLPLRGGAGAARGARRAGAGRVRAPASGGWSRSAEAAPASGSTRTPSRRARRLVLGGVEIPHDQGLPGHSDADVLAHAITDALLGAAGPRRHRPALPGHRRARGATPTRWSCCASWSARVGAIAHVDATVMMERPKLAPHRDAIRALARGGARLHASTSRRRPARGWASSAAARASRRWRWRRCSIRVGP